VEQHVLDGFDEISKVEATDQDAGEEQLIFEDHDHEEQNRYSDDEDGERVDDLESGQIFDMENVDSSPVHRESRGDKDEIHIEENL
jgi:hypothetical protein